jgi:glycine cleavage system aminomethyltransferase T
MAAKARHALISIGPRVRKSPYFAATLRHGARAFTVYNHTYMPTSYTDPVTEYWSLVNDVTLWDVSCQRQVEISGPDAFDFIQYLTPRDMSKCEVGQAQYLLLTDEEGGIINDAVMLRLEQQRFWLSPGDGDVLLWATGVAVNSGKDVNIIDPDVSPLQLQGPKAPQVAKALFGDWALQLKYYWLKETTLDGIPLVVARTGWSGELGYELYLRDPNLGDELWQRVMGAGKEFHIAPIAPSVIRSVEGRLLSYASDITRADNPYVLGMDRFVELDQPGDFIGRQALENIKAAGVKRHLAGVEIHGEPLAEANDEFWAVSDAGQKMGHITRCVYSPRLEKNIGFANIPIAYAAIGTDLVLATPLGERTATVCESPWFPAQTAIPKES